jgi:hypothetical protein
MGTDKEYIENYSGKTSYKTFTWNTDRIVNIQCTLNSHVQQKELRMTCAHIHALQITMKLQLQQEVKTIYIE